MQRVVKVMGCSKMEKRRETGSGTEVKEGVAAGSGSQWH